MGKEAHVRAVLPDGADEGRLQYEPPKLIFRGASRRVFDAAALAGVRAVAGDLVLADGTRFALGEKAAAKWAEAIFHPKSRIDKLGVKADQRIALLDIEDQDIAGEIAARGAALVDEPSNLDILFYAADDADALARIGELIGSLGPRGAIWVVSRKGKAATVKDVDVMAAAKARGLVDNKVCAFSDTHTALRFSRRR